MNKSFYIIFALLLIVAILQKIIFKKSPSDYPFEKLKLSDIAEFEIKSPQWHFIFKKDKDEWSWNQPFRLATEKPGQIISALSKLRTGPALGRSTESLSGLSLDEGSGIFLKVRNKKGEIRELVLGRSAPDGHSYFRWKNENDVRYARGINRGLLGREADYFRNRAVFSFKEDETERIILSRGAMTYEFTRSSQTWTIKTAKREMLLDENMKNVFPGVFSGLTASGFADKADGKEIFNARFISKSGEETVLSFIESSEHKDEYLVTSSRFGEIFLIYKNIFENFLKELSGI
ncbi:MAG TPA: DUF4340 domain-containing protein [bacterium]|nr:DUF4340 domain-containing protein [bacterium]